MTSIVPIIHQVENDYDKKPNNLKSVSVNDADPFDERLVQIRKDFNNGKDPVLELIKGKNIKAIQKQMDKGTNYLKIADKYDISVNKINYLIAMGVLSGEHHYPRKYDNDNRGKKKAVYKLYKNKILICEGTKQEISELTSLTYEQVKKISIEKYRKKIENGAFKLKRIGWKKY